MNRIMLATVALGTLLGLSLARAAATESGAGGYRFEVYPRPGQCYPSDPTTKKYLQEKVSFGVTWKKFSCDFACVEPDGHRVIVTGTQTDWFFMGDDGTHFVCQGYVMGFVETPMDPRRLGYMTIEAIRPFDPNTTKIKELKAWSAEVFGASRPTSTRYETPFSFEPLN
jgi:hypothetical protein